MSVTGTRRVRENDGNRRGRSGVNTERPGGSRERGVVVRMRSLTWSASAVLSLCATGCGDPESEEKPRPGKDPDTAEVVAVDRFSAAAGTLLVRDDTNGLPPAGAPIDFDEPPFVTLGLGPRGERVEYYGFDVQSRTPATRFVFYREGEKKPLAGQLDIIDTVPGDDGYSDFFRVTRVTVPSNYAPNTITRARGVEASGYETEPTDVIVNAPVVPMGSSATRRLEGSSGEARRAWYRDEIAYYFSFEEDELRVGFDAANEPVAPIAYIFVTFNINPNEPGGGPPSGFVTEPGSAQTHNVVEHLPGDEGYSPLWHVMVYDSASFDEVGDLASAMAARPIGIPAALVNCPLLSVTP